MQLAVNDLSLAQTQLQGEPESVASFADIEFCETNEEAFFFANSIAENKMRYANRIQTWIELSRGDARQRTVARDIHEQISKETSDWMTS